MPNYYKKKRMSYVQEHWGKDYSNLRKTEVRFADLESHFVSMMKRADWILDDQTWNDLEMNQVYCKLDRAYSTPGEQVLYNQLRTPIYDEEELQRRDRVMEFIQHNKDERDKIACMMYFLGKADYDGAASLLFKGVPKLPRYAGWARGLALAMLLALISIPFIKLTGLMFSLVMFVVNTIYHQKFNMHTESSLPGVQYLAKMLIAADEIAKLEAPQLEKDYNSFFRKCFKKCETLRKKAGLTGGENSDPLGILEYFKMIFLVEDRAYIRCMDYVEELAPVLRVLYRKIGELDALMSIASYRRGMRHMAKPVFVKEPRYLRVDNILHPLLEQDGVPNSLEINNSNVVITGSNMSGKSTFLRTLATGALMAQTYYTVCADGYTGSFFNLGADG